MLCHSDPCSSYGTPKDVYHSIFYFLGELMQDVTVIHMQSNKTILYR